MLIETQKSLDKLCAKITRYRVIAVDTEFVRDRSYYPKLCLMQVEAGGKLYAIDMLKALDFSKLAGILANPKILKVFHAPSQDLEVIRHMMGIKVQNIYDTQLAAMFNGHQHPPSYNKLVQEFFGVDVPKDLQYSDWTIRPLPKDMLKYSVVDVKYLRGIRQKLNKILKKDGKIPFYEEESIKYDEFAAKVASIYQIASELIKPQSDLDNAKRAVLLVLLREKIAQKLDKHRNRVLHDSEIERSVNAGQPTKMALRRLSETVEITDEDQELIRRTAMELLEPRGKKDLLDKKLMADLRAMLEKASTVYRISPQVIATKSDLTKFAIGEDGSRIASGWRYKIFGKKVQVFLKKRSTKK